LCFKNYLISAVLEVLLCWPLLI